MLSGKINAVMNRSRDQDAVIVAMERLREWKMLAKELEKPPVDSNKVFIEQAKALDDESNNRCNRSCREDV